jgi:hypothetical protein
LQKFDKKTAISKFSCSVTFWSQLYYY